MPLTTPLTSLLGITHPILSAPMAAIAGARLVAAVSEAGGFGILGGGYGDKAWLEQETAKLQKCKAPFGIGFITWSMAKQPELARHRAEGKATRDHAVVRRSQAACIAHQGGGQSADLPGAERRHGQAGARCRRRHLDRAGHRSRRPWRLAHPDRHRARGDRSRGRPRARRRGGRSCRWAWPRSHDDAGRKRRDARHALLCQRRMRRRGRGQETDLRRRQRRDRAQHHLRCVAQSCGGRRLSPAAP